MLVRNEEQRDWASVRALNASVFETLAEANLVEILRVRAHPVVSLVALDTETIAGHIMFSPVSLSGCPDLNMMGLGPMAVTPAHQRQGVGSALVCAGLDRCKELGVGAVVVLGHPTYYPRFGFLPAARFGVGCEYDVSQEVFMLVELLPGYLRGASGTIKYNDAFSNV